VLPEHAGHRLAARLIDAVAKRAAALGFATLTLSTFRDIPWNAPYYRQLGFHDLDDLGPGLRAVREKHRELGLNEADRVFMARPIAAL
jgi:GNAT superfamily N-acetyltransferase